MLYREIIAVCSQIHTKHINTLCGQNVELVNVKLAVRIVTTGLERPDPPTRNLALCVLLSERSSRYILFVLCQSNT